MGRRRADHRRGHLPLGPGARPRLRGAQGGRRRVARPGREPGHPGRHLLAGRISVGGTEVTALDGAALAEYRRHGVGIVFQAFNLIASLTARENVAAPLRLAGVARRAAQRRADELLERVGLGERLLHRPRELSGGQQQRVAIARALVHDPPLIVADEPTAHLDYVAVEDVLRLIRRLAAPGRLVVVATHDSRFTPLADRVIDLAPSRPEHVPAIRNIELATGEILSEQGDAPDLVYVVEEGALEAYRHRPDGTEDLLSHTPPGSYVGEIGVLAGLPRSASVRAAEPTRLTGYGPREFRAWSQDEKRRERAEKSAGDGASPAPPAHSRT